MPSKRHSEPFDWRLKRRLFSFVNVLPYCRVPPASSPCTTVSYRATLLGGNSTVENATTYSDPVHTARGSLPNAPLRDLAALRLPSRCTTMRTVPLVLAPTTR